VTAPVVTGFGSASAMGDGLQWLGGSNATIDKSVTFRSNGRFAAIIDANSAGSFQGTLTGGDESIGIIIQGGTTATQPTAITTGDGLKVQVEIGEKYPVAGPVATGT
jgi:hypothetical protein